MKVLALNGSPRMKSSSTYNMLKPLLEGMHSAGAQTDLIHIRELNLKFCTGCYSCWVRTPGECIHKGKDGMQDVMPLYNQADLIIFATPLYHFNMSAIMKNFIDRTLPRIEPWLIPHPEIPGLTSHPERFRNPSKVLLVSPCGFPEFEHFSSLVATFKQIANFAQLEYVGEILRPAAEPLSNASLQNLFDDYYQSLHQAGKQIITNGSISIEVQDELKRDLFPGGKQAFYEMSSAYWQQKMDHFNVPEENRHSQKRKTSLKEVEIADRNLLNCHDTIAGMPIVFNAKAARNINADIQFIVSGSEPGKYYLHIDKGTCTFHEGETSTATMTINTPSEVWLAISRGEKDGQKAFIQQEYSVHGEFALLMKMNELFQ
ncbi:MAG: NAD(P)H-dependent oxidoreductase [Anaerolineaceae bacterium]|nr:NAD(P)H-dependent oxidoreductase [Anaerolineaceae bacterium]